MLVSAIATALSYNGFTNLKAYKFDASTAPQIVIAPGGGTIEVSLGGGNDVKYSRVQVLVRDRSMQTAETTIDRIISKLHKNSSISSVTAVLWDGRQPTYFQDGEYHIFAAEFVVIY